MIRAGGSHSVKEDPNAPPTRDGRGEDAEADYKRMTFDVSKGFREQGFAGPVVMHADKKTTTVDWRTEYGPKFNPDHPPTYEGICKEHPESTWCQRHGLVPKILDPTSVNLAGTRPAAAFGGSDKSPLSGN